MNQDIQLGTILAASNANTLFNAGRVRGISPDGSQVILGWLGVVPATALEPANPDTEGYQFAALYRPVTVNEWGVDTTPPSWVPPVQLELPLDQRRGCNPGEGIPGLDAELCRCWGCRRRATGGVWWADGAMRERVLKRRTAYQFKAVLGDGLRDLEE